MGGERWQKCENVDFEPDYDLWQDFKTKCCDIFLNFSKSKMIKRNFKWIFPLVFNKYLSLFWLPFYYCENSPVPPGDKNHFKEEVCTLKPVMLGQCEVIYWLLDLVLCELQIGPCFVLQWSVPTKHAGKTTDSQLKNTYLISPSKNIDPLIIFLKQCRYKR